MTLTPCYSIGLLFVVFLSPLQFDKGVTLDTFWIASSDIMQHRTEKVSLSV